MESYSNKFEKSIANVSFSTDWFEMRNNIVHVIDEYYDYMDFFRKFQSTPTDDPNRFRSLIFMIYGDMYMYNEVIENGKIESGQLDKIIHIEDDWSQCVSVVLYSNVVNSRPCAPVALKYYKVHGMYEIDSHLNKDLNIG